LVSLTLIEGCEIGVGSERGSEDVGSLEQVPDPLAAEGGGHDLDKLLATILVSKLRRFLFGTN